MVHLSTRRALAAALVLLLSGGLAAWALSLSSAAADAHERRPAPEAKNAKDAKGSKGADKGKPAKGTTPAPATTPATSATPATTATPAPGAPAASSSTPADPAAPAVPAAAAAPAGAELGRTVALAPVSGTVLVRTPGGAATPLTVAAGSLPTGTRVDTRRGAVALTSAVDAAGTTQTGRFSGGVFEVRQKPGGRGVTQLILVGGHWAACRAGTTPGRAAVAHAAAKKRKPIRRLWGSDDHGRFQTRGGGSIATVRGTRWLTEDFCDGTRTTVTAGAVSVRSRRTGRTVTVRAGHSRFVAR